MRKSKVLAKLRNGECVISIGISFTSSSRVTELAGLTGFDCLWIDMEHRPFDYDDVFHLVQGARAADTDCVVRIRKECEANYFRPLEDGAAGIMVPDCKSAQEAREVISHCKYPPLGSRGIDGVGPDADYGMVAAKEYMTHANRETFVIVQIEDRETVERVDEIAAVEGVDILFIGPGDLTKSYGILGDTKNPIFMDAVKKVADAAARHGKWWGLPAGNVETAQMYIDMGARFINCTSDRALLLKGMTEIKSAYSALKIKA